MSSKHQCKCLTCESIGEGTLDYRAGAPSHVNGPCRLCEIKEDSLFPEKRMVVGRRHYIPEPAREFVGGELCEWCIHGIHWQLTNGFRTCWMVAPPELIELAILVLLRNRLNSIIYFRGPKIMAQRAAILERRAEWEKQRAEEGPQDIEIPIKLKPRIRSRVKPMSHDAS